MGDLPGRADAGRRRAPTPALLVKGKEVPLPSGASLIGRGPGCRVSFAGGLISRRHARLTNTSGRVTIEDLGSKNGVFVNGRRIDRATALQDGDTILIGTTELTYFLGSPEDAEPPSIRFCFDEQGNLLSEANDETDNVPTQVHFEPVAPEPVEFDREDITTQGSRPPPPRMTSGLLQREAAPPLTKKPEAAPQPALPALELELDFNPAAAVPDAAPPSSDAKGGRTGTLPSARLPGLVPIARVTSSAPPRRARETDPASADPFMAVIDVVSRMLARSDHDAAARTLGAQLARRLELVEKGQPLDATTLDAAGSCCLELCQVIGDPHWFDQTLQLYSTLRRPMGANVLERLSRLLRVVPAQSGERFAEYQVLVRSLLGEVEVTELHACEQILAIKA